MPNHIPLHPIQVERYRNMTPDEKHAVFLGLMQMAYAIKRAAIERDFPNDPPEAINRRLARAILHGTP